MDTPGPDIGTVVTSKAGRDAGRHFVVLQVLDALVVQRTIDRRSLQLGLFPTLVAATIGYHLHGPGVLLVSVSVVAMLVAVVNDTGSVRALREAAHPAPSTG